MQLGRDRVEPLSVVRGVPVGVEPVFGVRITHDLEGTRVRVKTRDLRENSLPVDDRDVRAR